MLEGRLFPFLISSQRVQPPLLPHLTFFHFLFTVSLFPTTPLASSTVILSPPTAIISPAMFLTCELRKLGAVTVTVMRVEPRPTVP